MVYDNPSQSVVLGIGIDEWSTQLATVLCTVRYDGNGIPVTWHFPRPIPVDQTYTLRVYRVESSSMTPFSLAVDSNWVAVTITLRRAV